MKEPACGESNDDQLHQPTHGIRSNKDAMQLDKRGVGEDQRQRTDQPNCRCEFQRTGCRIKPEPSDNESKNPTTQKWQRSGQGDRLGFDTLPPDFRYVKRR